MEKKNIPALRFPEFKGEWESKKYYEIYTFKPNNSFTRENLNYQTGTIKNIHYGDIHTKFSTLFNISKEQTPFINPEISTNFSEDNYCKEGDVIIADASEDYEDIGKSIEIINLNKEKVLAGLHTILARPDLHKIAIGFSGYLMKSPNFRLQVKKIAQGTKVLSISTKQLNLTTLSFPTLPEQQKIASFFTAIDQKLTQLRQKKTLLEKYKKGVMQKLFSQEIRFKDENGKEFPKWEKKKLGELGKFYAGGDLDKLDYSKVQDEKHFYPIYANGMGEGIYGFATTYQYKPNCVTVSGRGNLGYAKHRTNNFNAIVRLIVIEPKEAINPKFLEESINQIKFAVESTGVPQLTVPQIITHKIPMPNLMEQTKIANFLSLLDEKISQCQKQIEQTERWKKGLLQQMFV